MGLLIFKITSIVWMLFWFFALFITMVKIINDGSNESASIFLGFILAWILVGVGPVFICVKGWRLIL